jgi:hypothetical protein
MMKLVCHCIKTLSAKLNNTSKLVQKEQLNNEPQTIILYLH